jgi:alkanesulfonate monooxygenase SsuD/methylene tetrahydromethanopterin reductase-like flavin-dependent oxidoreductase (luciferase family)
MQSQKPHVMLGFNVFVADTDAEAEFRASSWQQAFVNLRSGRPGRLPPPVEGYRQRVGPSENALLDSVLSCSAVGSPETVRAGIDAFIARTGADELMITSQVFDHAARLRSYALLAGLRETATA